MPNLDFSGGFAGASAALTLNGSAAVSGSLLRLTDGKEGEAGSAFSTAPQGVATFTTDFRFLLTDPNADGFTFTIQGQGATALGPTGGGLGYGPDEVGGTGGISKSVAVKFDLFDNQGEGSDSTGLYTNGAAPTNTGAIDLSGTGIDLHSGHVFDVAMAYDGTNLKVSITDTATMASANQSYAVNIPTIVGASAAFVGFTGATGGLTATQDILTWTYTANPPAPAAPTNVTATAGNMHVSVSWTASPGAASYNVYKSTTSNAETLFQQGVVGTSFADTAVTSGTTYFYEVTAVGVGGEGPKSNEASVTADGATKGLVFPDGFAGAGGLLTRNGSAAFSGSALRLTDGKEGEAGSAFSTSQQNIASFTTDFKFLLTNPDGDGFTFTIQGQGATALGPSGGGLGYGPDEPGGTGGISKSVAVKFDLFDNQGEGPDSTGLYTNGASPTNAGSIDLRGTAIHLHSGDIFDVAMAYDGTTLKVSITDTATGGVASQSYTVNIPAIVGGNTAFVGFTGATGGLTATQDILSWTYTPGLSGPPAPTNVTATAGNMHVSVSWTASPGATSYNVYKSTASNTETLFQQAITGTSFADTAVTSGTTYFYKVTAVGVGGEGPQSAEASVTADGATKGLVFPGGFAGASGLLTRNGSAAFSGSSLRLTDGKEGEAGSAFSTNQQNIAKFTTDFKFLLTSANADGFTFTIQGQGATALGPTGGGLGYGPDEAGGTGGISKSVAVKFDLFDNQGEGSDSTGLYTNGASPTNVGSIDLSGTGIQLHQGDIFDVTLGYDGTTLTVTITDTVTTATAKQSYTVNIPTLVGGSTAFVGFTGATGGRTAVQDILSWTYTPS